MKKISFLLVISVFLFGIACNSSKKTTKTTSTTTVIEEETLPANIAWDFVPNAQRNLSDVLAKAKAEKKLVFIDAYATWCGPCKLMDRNVFTHSETATFFNKNFISYKVNIEKDNGPTVQLLYEISTLPSLIFLDSNGKVLVREGNSVTINQLRSMAERAIAKAK
jgi:thiol:disulfide interchange protein